MPSFIGLGIKSIAGSSVSFINGLAVGFGIYLISVIHYGLKALSALMRMLSSGG